MNGIKEQRYSASWEKLSKRLRLLYDCYNCREQEYDKKECHHIDGNKKNSTIQNCIVLCKKCHNDLHNDLLKITNFVPYNSCGYSVTVARFTSSKEDWFNSKHPLKLLPNLPAPIANEFRKRFVKGFIKPGSCNYYLGLEHNNNLIGVLGFSNPEHCNFDVVLKADTTPSDWQYSTDLLLFVLRSKQTKEALEKKFNREINTAYSMCFSQHHEINRYRKHGELIKKVEVKGGFNLGYIFKLGGIPSLKSAKALWMQNHKIQ